MTRVGIPKYAHRDWIAYVKGRAIREDSEARDLLDALPKKGIPKPKLPDRKAGKRSERKERIAKIREVVMARADGLCEWCGAKHMTLELHHVLQGASRRSEERQETCAAVCWDCHRQWHRHDLGTVSLAKAWALRLFLPDALREIERRMAKLTPLARAVRS